MTADTSEENSCKDQFGDCESVWLFGYGSLIYKVDFPYLERKPATIRNWVRRFWQGSHDHRGTEDNPGCVVTLISKPGSVCGGVAYCVEPSVFRQLDIREKNGYLRFPTQMTFRDESHVDGLVYIATSENDAFLGEASEYEIAKHIAAAEGQSGPNCEYLFELAIALRELGEFDEHVFEIERCLNEIGGLGNNTL